MPNSVRNTPAALRIVVISIMVAITLIATSLSAPVISAKADDYLYYGSVVSGSVTDNVGDEWFFIGCSGDLVTVEMVSDELDSYVEIYDSDSRWPIAEDDDSGSAGNALIEEFELEESGIYTVVAAGATRRDQGEYSLAIDSGGYSEINDKPTLAYNNTVDGEVKTIRGEKWLFWGCADDVVTVTMESDEIAGYLELYGPTEKQPLMEALPEKDGSAKISEFALPESGIFTVVAAGYSRRDRGNYTLSLLTSGPGEIDNRSASSSSRVVPTFTTVPVAPTREPTSTAVVHRSSPTSSPTQPPLQATRATSTPIPTDEPATPTVTVDHLPAPVALAYDFPYFRWGWEGMPAMHNVDNWYFDVKIFNSEHSEYPYDVKVAEVEYVAEDGPNLWRYDKRTDFQCGSFWAVQIAKRNPDGSYAGPMSPESNRVPSGQGCENAKSGGEGTDSPNVDDCPGCE
jgi:hypothetical protein